IYGFELDLETAAAIREMAAQITVVSAERIAQEMRMMLVHASRARAFELLRDVELLETLLPELLPLLGIRSESAGMNCWEHTLQVLQQLANPSFPLALSALLLEVGKAPNNKIAKGKVSVGQLSHSIVAGSEGVALDMVGAQTAAQICRRWKLSCDDEELVCWL